MASFFISYCSFLILWPWTVWKSQFEEDEMWKRKKSHSYLGEGQGAQRVWRERNGGCPEDVGRTGNGAVCAEAAHAADVGQLSRRHVCGSIRVWGTPRGRGGQGNAFRSPVILHNAGQIRLELTAEDIQLDCSCHSVASIRVSPDAFVFAITTREITPRSVSLCHFHLCRPLDPDFFIISIIECCMLDTDITGDIPFLDFHCSLFRCYSIAWPKESTRWQIKVQFLILRFLLILTLKEFQWESFTCDVFSLCRETSSTCSSDPGLFTNDEGGQGIKRQICIINMDSN